MPWDQLFCQLPVLAIDPPAGAPEVLILSVGFSVLAAALLGALFVRLRIPEIAGFLLAGVLIGPIGLQLVQDQKSIGIIGDLGLILLLFTNGLSINVRKLKASGQTLILAGVFCFPLSVLLGWGLGYLLQATGWEVLQGPYVPLYLGLAAGGAASLVVCGVLRARGQMDTVVGRLCVGLLIFQDLWGIIVLAIQPTLPPVGPLAETSTMTGGQFPLTTLGITLLGILLLLTTAILSAKFVLPLVFRWIAKRPELMLVLALGWCFGVVLMGVYMGPITASIGLKLPVVIGAGMGALIAGASLASMPYAGEVVSKVEIVKNFFVTLFFVSLGMRIPVPEGAGVLLLALAVFVAVHLARYLVCFPLLYLTGLDRRNAFVISAIKTNIWTLGLVILYYGWFNGHFGPQDDPSSQTLITATIFAFVAGALIAPTKFAAADRILKFITPLLERIGFKPYKDLATNEQATGAQVMLLGFHRVASSLLSVIQQRRPDLVSQIAVIDFNVALHRKIDSTGATALYGDISDSSVLKNFGLDKARVLVCTVPDDVLKDTSNLELTHAIRRLNSSAKVIVTALSNEDAEKMYQAGADYVLIPRLESGLLLASAIDAALSDELTGWIEEHPVNRDTITSHGEVMP